jgi:methylenetetrahydrofolate reductase (NADPH)
VKVLDLIKNAKAPAFAFELMGSGSLREILETLEYLSPVKPAWVSVTSQCQNPLEICGAIQTHFRIPALAQLSGLTREQSDDAIEELHGYGVENLLIEELPFSQIHNFVNKRAGANMADFKSKPLALGDQKNEIVNIEKGNLLQHASYSAYNFCIGVTGYPETETDLANLKKKVDAGAHYITTQMFFDNQRFFDFAERCRLAGIQVPIVPALRVLQAAEQIETIPKRFHVSIPAVLADGLLSNPEHAGKEWAIEQAKDLMRNGFPLVQFCVLNDKATVKEVADALITP